MNRDIRTSWWASGLAALTLAACSPAPGPDAGTDVPALPEAAADAAGEAAVDAAADAHGGDTAGDAGATLSIRGFVAPIAGTGVAGVEVADELHPAVTPAITDADGMFTLRGVPIGARVLIRVTAAGYLGLLIPMQPFDGVTEFSMGELPLFTRGNIDTALASAMVTTTAGTGIVSFNAPPPAMRSGSGVVATVTPSSGRAVYNNSFVDPPVFDGIFGATTIGGDGLIVDVAPGEVQVTATSIAHRSCTSLAGWEGAAPGSMRVPIRADHFTVTTFQCPPTAGRRFVSGRLTEYQAGVPAARQPGLAGVEVCLHGDATTPCSTSLAGGIYAIEVPESVEIALAMRATGRDSVLVPLRPAMGDSSRNVGLPVAGYAGTMAAAFSTTQGADTGSIEFFTSAGVTATLVPAAATGAHYLAAGAVPDPALMATSMLGWGYFFGAAPGEVTLTFTHPTQTCVVINEQGWAGTTPGTIRVPVAAGFTSFGSLRCM